MTSLYNHGQALLEIWACLHEFSVLVYAFVRI